MYKFIPAVVSALGLYASTAAAQAPIQIPDQVGAGGGAGADSCNGCYVVADVAGVAFGTETVTATRTDLIITTSGSNGTVYTTTSIVFDPGHQFTFDPSGNVAPPAPTGGGNYNLDGSTLVVSGVTLTSPTAYNVFTGYTVVQSVFTNGACQVEAGGSTNLASAYSVAIPPGSNYAEVAEEAQGSFVSFIGRVTCSLAAVEFNPTTQIPMVISTTQVTTSNAPSLAPATVATTSTPSPTQTFIPLSGFNYSRTTFLPQGTGTIIISGSPITEAGAPRTNAIGSLFAGALAFLGAIIA